MIRIGQGIDFHRFIENRDLIIGGIRLDEPYGLAGHSDADVLLHAIMDAILGALGKGDIGEHFPDNDETYYNISSVKLLEEVMTIMKFEGYEITNIDVTLIGEKPRFSAFKQEIKGNLIELLDTKNINIKATTTEKMGDLGKGEGLGAMAIVLLSNGTL